MRNLLFCVIGETGSGRSTIIRRTVEKLKGKVRIVKQTTVKEPARTQTDSDFDNFTELSDFLRSLNIGLFVTWEMESERLTALGRADLNHALLQSHGIASVSVSAIKYLTASGFNPKVILLKPDYGDEQKKETCKPAVSPDLVVVNSFREGGLQSAVNQLVDYISTFPVES